jgi:hypothetical protein
MWRTPRAASHWIAAGLKTLRETGEELRIAG